MEQRNRLTSLNREVADADETLRTLTDAARNAAKTRDEAGKRRQQLREGLREGESALVKAEQHLSQLNQRLQLAGAKVEALSQAVERLRVDEAAWQARRLEADALLANLAEPAELESLLGRLPMHPARPNGIGLPRGTRRTGTVRRRLPIGNGRPTSLRRSNRGAAGLNRHTQKICGGGWRMSWKN